MRNDIHNLPQKFRKGHKPWNKGKKATDELKSKLSKIQKELHESGFYNKQDSARKISKVMKGRRPQDHINWRPPMTGKKHSIETRRKISVANKGKTKGEKNANWQGGISFQYKLERSLAMEKFEYRFWRELVFEKDDYTCVFCGVRGGRLQADHIRPWNLFPELRYEIENGRTLCISCHRKTDTYGSNSRIKK